MLNNNNNSMFLSGNPEEVNSKYTIQEATNKIRDLVTDLKEHGIKTKILRKLSEGSTEIPIVMCIISMIILAFVSIIVTKNS